ncbi:MAG TPA: type IV secretion system protein [Ochrobactrum sp.]|nr:type IV secretion system protein [Ochrobactrum sp.]
MGDFLSDIQSSDFLSDILGRVDNTGGTFSATAYGIIGPQMAPLLNTMLIGYLAFYGLQLLMGTSRISVATVVNRAFRMIFIVTLINNWSYFDEFIYKWLNETPKELGSTLLGILHTNVTDTTAGLSKIWECANKAASAFAEQSGYTAVLPSAVGLLIMAGALAFIALALSMLLLAKIATWVLIGTAPIFIACMLFEQSRGIAWAWFQQLLLYALLPLFVYVICAFLITAIDQDLKHVLEVAEQRKITLLEVRSFLLLCVAGAFIVANIHSLARGIAAGMTAGIGNIARKALYVTGLGETPYIARTGARDSTYWGGRSRFHRFDHGVSLSPINQGAKEAMQNRIRSHSLPQ